MFSECLVESLQQVQQLPCILFERIALGTSAQPGHTQKRGLDEKDYVKLYIIYERKVHEIVAVSKKSKTVFHMTVQKKKKEKSGYRTREECHGKKFNSHKLHISLLFQSFFMREK